jgi:hypothetical protein
MVAEEEEEVMVVVEDIFSSKPVEDIFSSKDSFSSKQSQL